VNGKEEDGRWWRHEDLERREGRCYNATAEDGSRREK